MGWTLLSPHRRPKTMPAKVNWSLRATKHGTAGRLTISKAFAETLGPAWVEGTRVNVSLGDGADRGRLRLTEAADGLFQLSGPGGRGAGALALLLGCNPAWADTPGKWPLPDLDVEVAEGALTVRLPAEALTTKARAARP